MTDKTPYPALSVEKPPHCIWFFLARIFGSKVSPYAVYWRGKYWVHTPIPIGKEEV